MTDWLSLVDCPPNRAAASVEILRECETDGDCHDEGTHCLDGHEGMAAERRFEAFWRCVIAGVCIST